MPPTCHPPARAFTNGFVRFAAASPDRQFVEHRVDQAVAHVEGRESPLTLQAEALLRIKGVIALHADAAGFIDRFRVGVRRDETQSGGKTPGQFDTAGVIVAIGSIVH
jgi:hypothetical protein